MTLSLYTNPRGLYEFQSTLAAFVVLRPNNLLVADTGLGKGHIAMAAIAVLLEDREIDIALVIAEGSKMDEWPADFEEFTSMDARVYSGDPVHRHASLDTLPQVLIMTYNTALRDLITTDGKGSKRKVTPGPLLEALQGKKVMIVCDEMTTVANRSGVTHKAIEVAAKRLGARMLGLTATPVTESIESLYNLGRILCPAQVGTVARFETDHVVRRNNFGVVVETRNDEGLVHKMSGVLLRKRKTDPDVRAQFPKTIEDFTKLPLAPDHFAAYQILETITKQMEAIYSFKLLHAFANHPTSILTSTADAAYQFLQIVPSRQIEGLVCSKSEAVVHYTRGIVAQGDQEVIFCDSVQVLLALKRDLADAGIEVAEYHGMINKDDRPEQKRLFRSGERRVLLASKAGERGMNLPEATYITNYDVPLLHMSYIQRINRGSRIGSNVDGILIAKTFVAAGTVEEGAVRAWLRRNDQSDATIDLDVDPEQDEEFVFAAARVAMMKEAHQHMKETA